MIIARGNDICAIQSKRAKPVSPLKTSKYSSNLYEKPTASFDLINPEKINKPPTKTRATCVIIANLPIKPDAFISASNMPNIIANVVLLIQGGVIK